MAITDPIKRKRANHSYNFRGSGMLITIIIILFIVYFGTIVYYAKHNGYNISNDSSKWSDFGEFINGAISPLIAIGTIIALWFIERAVSDFHKAQLKQQRRYEAIKYTIDKIERYFDLILEISIDKGVNYEQKIKQYCARLKLVFLNLKTSPLIDIVDLDDQFWNKINSSINEFEISISSNAINVSSFLEMQKLKEALANNLYRNS